MLESFLKERIAVAKRQGLDSFLIKNILKEVIQIYILDFIYNSSYGKGLIFCGGSSLRFCFGLNRLSEDLDFDLEREAIDKKALLEELLNYFQRHLQFSKIEGTISGKEEKIYLKFPILNDLGLAATGESKKLYVKIEIQKNISNFYRLEFRPFSKFNLNFVIKTYALETLFSSKIIAILSRTFRKGKGDEITFKGRDYYDFLWFLEKKITPDMERIKDVLRIENMGELKNQILKKIEGLSPRYLKEDLRPLFEDSRFLESYCKNYLLMVKGLLKDWGQ